MRGDTYYEWIISGSTAASADTAHRLFGNYGGLSDLNSEDVVHVQLLASAQNFNFYRSLDAASQLGQRFVAGNDYYIDMPPVRSGHANDFHFQNETNGSNAHIFWVVWARRV